MPNDNKELQAGFPARARAAKRKATTALQENRGTAGGGLSLKERAGHQDAIAAADRVLKRTGAGPGPSSDDVVKPGKKKKGSTPASRRRVVEKAVGTDKLKDPLAAVKALADAAKEGK